MKRLFILEDEPNAIHIVDWIRRNSSVEVIHARTIEDAVYYFEYCGDSAINSYSYFMFDVSVPNALVTLANGEKKKFYSEDGFNGIILYNHYSDRIKKSGAKIAFITAFANQIKNRNDIQGMEIIDKTSGDFVKNISTFLAL